MSVLIVDQQIRDKIAAMIERAHAKPVSWDKMKDGAIAEHKTTVALADRKPGYERPASENIIMGGYRVCYSVEQQPVGMCRHLSISTLRPGKVPNIPVVQEVCHLFGFKPDPGAPLPGTVWLEEFDPGHHAVNVVQVINEVPVGHA